MYSTGGCRLLLTGGGSVDTTGGSIAEMTLGGIALTMGILLSIGWISGTGIVDGRIFDYDIGANSCVWAVRMECHT